MQHQRTRRLAIYNASERLHGYTTGVGKHVKHMTAGLASNPDLSVTFLVPSDHWHLDQICPIDSQLGHVHSARLPIPRRAMALMARYPSALPLRSPIEKFLDDFDWIYSPRELHLPNSRARVVMTIHDLYSFEPENRRRLDPKWWLSYTARCASAQQADAIIAVSEFTKGRIVELLHVEASRVWVVPNGVDDLFFEAADWAPADVAPLNTATYVFSIGGITRKKGGRALLDYARLLHDFFPSIRLVVLGPVEHPFLAEVGTLPNLIVLGRGIEDSLVARWLRGAVATVVFSNYEGFGIPALESMAAGVPVIVNKQPALVEVVGDNAIIVDANSSRGLIAALDLLNDEKTRTTLASRGKRHAERFRWSASVEKLSKVFSH